MYPSRGTAPCENPRPSGLDGTGIVCRYPGVSSWIPDSTRSRFNVFGGKFWFYVFSFIFSLICFVRVSPRYLVSGVVSLLFIKQNENLFQRGIYLGH
jgi:hypothetical protein